MPEPKLFVEYERFIRTCLGGEITQGQREALLHFCNGERYLLLRACNGAGKTAFMAALALAVLDLNPVATVLALSKNMTHLQRNFMKELRRQANRCPRWAGKKVLRYSYNPEPGKNIYALAPNQAEAAQGFHDPVVVVMVDEGTGIPEMIWESLMANMSSESSQLVSSFNPMSPDAFVYKAETEYKWKTVGLSAFDHPNVQFGKEVIKGAVTREWVDDMLRIHSASCDASFPNALFVPWQNKYFERTASIAIRVLGEYHLIHHDGFIDPNLIADSFSDLDGDWHTHRASGTPLLVGIDISRGIKDRTIASILRHDGVVLGFENFYETNLSVLAQKIQQRFPNDILAVDDTGCGSGVVDRLYTLGHPSVYPVHFNSRPRHFYKGHIEPSNARTEMYLMIEHNLRNGFLKIPRDPGLTRELTAWKVNSVFGGRYVRVDYKTVIARRLAASPDKSDALALALYAYFIRKQEQFCYVL